MAVDFAYVAEDVVVSDTEFINNNADTYSSGAFGASFADSITATRVEVLGNTGGEFGGVLFSDVDEVSITGSIFQENLGQIGGLGIWRSNGSGGNNDFLSNIGSSSYSSHMYLGDSSSVELTNNLLAFSAGGTGVLVDDSVSVSVQHNAVWDNVVGD